MTTDSPLTKSVAVRLSAGPESFDAAAIALLDVGSEGVIEEDDGRIALTYFPSDQWSVIKPELERRLALVRRAFPEVTLIGETESGDENWLHEWKKFHRPAVVGRLWVGPPWLVGEAPADKIKLVIDPALAFGTGGHATTRMCLRAVVDFMVSAQSRGKAEIAMLDVGVGSGVLALGGLLLGVDRALGLDVDPVALETAKENAELAGLTAGLELSDRPLAELSGAYDLVTANLTRPVVEDLALDLVRLVAPAGRLAVSGLLREECGPTLELLTKIIDRSGKKLARKPQTDYLDEWSALVLDMERS